MSFYRDYNDKIAMEQWNTRPRPGYRHLTVTSISPALGAEVRGIDLRDDLGPEQLAEIKLALDDNLALIFRDQNIGPEEHKRMARHFGRLHHHTLAADRVWDGKAFDAEVLAWRTARNSRYTAGDAWHHDVSCDAAPIWASFLRITRLPEIGGGDTAFANLYLAYEALSEPMKRLLDGLTAIHDGGQAWTGGYASQPKAGQKFASSEHPVVARHPVSGRKFLFVNPAFTSHIVQLTRAESDAVLQLIYRHIERHLAFQARVRWSENSLLVWDNWAAVHHAVWDYYPFERWGERVSACRDHGPQH